MFIMNRKHLYGIHCLLPLLASACLTIGCDRQEFQVEEPAHSSSQDQRATATHSQDFFGVPDARKDILRLKLTEEASSQVRGKAFSQLRAGDVDLSAYLRSIHAKSLTPVFKVGGKYEKRQREAGLHLWYDVEFDDSATSLTQACEEAVVIPAVRFVEQLPKYTLRDALPFFSYSVPESDVKEMLFGQSSEERKRSSFDDPGLSKQWHYFNDGSQLKSVAGADINLFEAWEKETGKPGVIVAVLDGGVDVNHEDLKESMWINLAELNGQPDVDDDENGYVDDIHGYNFYSDIATIDPLDHGTHVAGTVAARNNNGIGVCGVAGGDGSPESGVRMMTCEIFHPNKGGSIGQEDAFVYAADNGAVISQNSWGSAPGIPLSPSVKAAIDYFIKNAGCDENGKQRPDSPMKGGVVIFAAGNDGIEGDAFPGAYNQVVAVSAMSPDWTMSYYTERGTWLDIMAPGGNKFYPDGNIYSTIPGNEYGYMQGTSMACPHVSGVAGLIVSHFGKQGFTNEDCKNILLTSLRPKDINAMNPNAKGRLGAGYIDAARALDENQNRNPGDPYDINVIPGYKSLTLEWKAPEDPDDRQPMSYRVYCSKDPISEADLKDAIYLTVSGLEFSAGEVVSCSVPNLAINTPYHLAIVAVDRWGLVSEATMKDAQTLNNFPPKLTVSKYDPIRLTGNETKEILITVEEPESQRWSYKILSNTRGVTIDRKDNVLKVTLTARNDFGDHKLLIGVYDELDFESRSEIDFSVYKNNAPRPKDVISKIFVPVGSEMRYDLTQYFEDIDGHSITYSSKTLNASVANVSESADKNEITIKGEEIGHSSVEITATDSQFASYRTIIPIQVVKDELVYQVYPVPAKDVLNVQLSNGLSEAEIEIRSAASNTLALKKTVQILKKEDRKVVLDISGIVGGSYVLIVKGDGKTYNRPFIKY